MEPVFKKSEKESETLRNKTLNTAHTHADHAIQLAKLLYEVKHSVVTVGAYDVEIVIAWGFKDWESYIENELEYHHGTAKAYVRIYETFFVQLRGKYDQKLLPKSITKLRALSKIVELSTCNTWLRRAARMSCCELEDAVQAALYSGKRLGKMKTLHVAMSLKNITTINNAVAQYRTELGHVNRGDALAAICQQWTAIHKNVARARGPMLTADRAH